MTIESKIERTNELLELLLTKFDHINSSVKNSDELEAVAGKKPADKKPAAKKPAKKRSVENETQDAPPEANDVKKLQAFKKTIVDIGRKSGMEGYSKLLKETLLEEGYSHSEKVPVDEYETIIGKIRDAFSSDADDDI